MTIYEKLRAVQVELKAPKGRENTYSNYYYRSAEDILRAVKPINEKNGLTLILSDELVLIGERYYVKAIAKLTDGEQEIVVNGFARETLSRKGQDDSQITGAASSYARKYALNGLYLIDDTKDADTDEFTEEMEERRKEQEKQERNDFKANRQEVVNRLKAVADGKNIPYEDVKRMVLEKTNEVLNRQDRDIVPANISKVLGYVIAYENRMKGES